MPSGALSRVSAQKQAPAGVVDESEPSSSRVVLRVLSILDRRAGDGMPSAIRRIARGAAMGSDSALKAPGARTVSPFTVESCARSESTHPPAS